MSDLSRIRILLVDDEPFIRTTIRQVLLHLGVGPDNVYDAASVREAIDRMRNARPDLVLCDIHMPGEDGFDLVSGLASVPQLSDIPVVMLTSDAGMEAVMTAKNLKVAGYLVKPVSANAVRRTLERVLAEERP